MLVDRIAWTIRLDVKLSVSLKQPKSAMEQVADGTDARYRSIDRIHRLAGVCHEKEHGSKLGERRVSGQVFGHLWAYKVQGRL